MKFILTNELGKLVRWLRIMGFDALYQETNNIGTLIITALREDRIIITRRQSKIDDLEKKTLILENDKLRMQLHELITKLKLTLDEGLMFSRCTACNTVLLEVKKEEAKELIPEHVYKTQTFFMQCSSCRRIYWQGSHWGNISKLVHDLYYADDRR